MTMRSLFLAAILFVLLPSCQRQPVDVLPPDDLLIDILVDLHMAEGAMQRVPVQMQDSIGTIIRSRVAAQHGLSAEALDTYLQTLQRDPEHSVALYDSVVVRLQTRQRAAESK